MRQIQEEQRGSDPLDPSLEEQAQSIQVDRLGPFRGSCHGEQPHRAHSPAVSHLSGAHRRGALYSSRRAPHPPVGPFRCACSGKARVSAQAGWAGEILAPFATPPASSKTEEDYLGKLDGAQ